MTSAIMLLLPLPYLLPPLVELPGVPDHPSPIPLEADLKEHLTIPPPTPSRDHKELSGAPNHPPSTPPRDHGICF
ncbi:hypothetical protein J3A83DRAFT_4369069 [Scleroderma citrinum]